MTYACSTNNNKLNQENLPTGDGAPLQASPAEDVEDVLH
jgi:hypothetical protein